MKKKKRLPNREAKSPYKNRKIKNAAKNTTTHTAPTMIRIFFRFPSSIGVYTLYPHTGQTPFSIAVLHRLQCIVCSFVAYLPTWFSASTPFCGFAFIPIASSISAIMRFSSARLSSLVCLLILSPYKSVSNTRKTASKSFPNTVFRASFSVNCLDTANTS